MLLRIFIYILCLKFVNCEYGGHVNWNQDSDARPYPPMHHVNVHDGGYVNHDGNNDDFGFTGAVHHDNLPLHGQNFYIQDHFPSNVGGYGNNADYNLNQVNQQFANLHPFMNQNFDGQHPPMHNYGHTKTSGGRKNQSSNASSSRSRGKRTRKTDSTSEGLGNQGEGQGGENVQGGGNMPLSVDPNELKQYRVEIYLKRFDGGTVLLLEPWTEVLRHRKEIQEIVHEKYSTINIEKVVKALKIADVTYRQVEDIENHKKDPELFGNVKFRRSSGKLEAAAGQTMTTKELADQIADWSNKGEKISNWMVQGKDYENAKFEPLFDGHIMVVLHDLDGIERFRIHFTLERLNLFDSVNKKNYFVIEDNEELVIMPEENFWNKGDPVRGTRWRDDTFYPQHGGMGVYTRPLTLYQILNIAYYNVIDGRTSDDEPIPFKCRHFGYEFITAIAADEFKGGLLGYKNWPENITFMDNQVTAKERITKPQYPTAFEHSFDKLTELAYFNDYDNNKYTQAIPIIPPNH